MPNLIASWHRFFAENLDFRVPQNPGFFSKIGSRGGRREVLSCFCCNLVQDRSKTPQGVPEPTRGELARGGLGGIRTHFGSIFGAEIRPKSIKKSMQQLMQQLMQNLVHPTRCNKRAGGVPRTRQQFPKDFPFGDFPRPPRILCILC